MFSHSLKALAHPSTFRVSSRTFLARAAGERAELLIEDSPLLISYPNFLRLSGDGSILTDPWRWPRKSIGSPARKTPLIFGRSGPAGCAFKAHPKAFDIDTASCSLFAMMRKLSTYDNTC